METYWRHIRHTLLKAVICLVFIGFFEVNGYAGLLPPPIILVQPLGISVLNGGTATIIAAAAPSLTKQDYYWFFNGQPVHTNANISISNASGLSLGVLSIISTLTISNVTSANGGVYSLRITNGGGSAISSNATLIVLSTTVSNVLNIVSSGTGMTASGFKILLSGPSGSNVVIQASTDLKNWTPISTNSNPSGTVSYTDTSATNQPFRYYRAAIQ